MKPTTPKPINKTAPVIVSGPVGTGPSVICGNLHWAQCLCINHLQLPDCLPPPPHTLPPQSRTPQGGWAGGPLIVPLPFTRRTTTKAGAPHIAHFAMCGCCHHHPV